MFNLKKAKKERGWHKENWLLPKKEGDAYGGAFEVEWLIEEGRSASCLIKSFTIKILSDSLSFY